MLFDSWNLHGTTVHANNFRVTRALVPAPAVPASLETCKYWRSGAVESRRHLLLGSLIATVANSCTPPAFASSATLQACQSPLSPIDVPLPASDAADRSAAGGQPKSLKLKYPRFAKGSVLNNGQGAPQVSLADDVLIQWGQSTYRLEQFTFHTPAEHALGGRRPPMDVQLVHRNTATGDLLVLAVALEIGATLPNLAINTALKSASPQPGVELPLNKPISLLALLPKPGSVDGRRPYASYPGTITLAPGGCPQSAQWVVFLDPLQVAARQVLELMYWGSGGRTLQLNAAPEQPVGDRQLAYAL